MSITAEAFDQMFAEQQSAAAQPLPPAVAQEGVTPDPNAAAAEATTTPEGEQGQPVTPAEQTEGESTAAEATPAAEATDSEGDQARDSKGRFVKVVVHAREMARRDTRIAELEKELETARAATPRAPATIKAFEDLKAKFAEDFPEQFDHIFGALTTELTTRDDKMAEMQKVIDQFNEREQQHIAEERAAVQSAVNAEIDKVDTLKVWRDAALAEGATEDAKALWDAAIATDNDLQARPAWRERPMAERFTEVVKRVAADYGIAVAKPKQAAPAPANPAAPQPKPLPAAAPPASLSNIAAAQPAPTPANPFAGRSLTSVINATRGMTRDQVEKALLHGQL